MTKKEIITIVNELREGTYYPDVDISPLSGCGLPDFPKNKMIRKEAIVMHLRWQCLYLNGNIDETELSYNLQIFKDKRIIMV
jgi:hypothetical protein